MNHRRLSLAITMVFASLSLRLVAAELVARPPITGISHIALYVHDLDKTRVFYKQFLGFEEPYTLADSNGAVHLTFIKINDRQSIELFPEKGTNTDRLNHIAFETVDAESLRVYLASQGVKVPDHVPTGRIGNRNFNVIDPDGHQVELVQYLPDGWTRQAAGKFMPDTRVSIRIRHVGIIVTNLESSLRFYCGVLGFKEIWRGSRSTNLLSWVNLKVPDGDDYLELMLYTNPPAVDKRGSAHHLSLEVGDIDQARTELLARTNAVGYTRAMAVQTGINRKRQLNLYDPDGTRVELMESGTVDGKPAESSRAPFP